MNVYIVQIIIHCLLLGRGIFLEDYGRNIAHSSADSPSGSMDGVGHFGIWRNVEIVYAKMAALIWQ